MFQITPKAKRAVAREWLLLLIVVLVSPSVAAVYTWVTAPATTIDEYQSFLLYDYFVPDSMLPHLREELRKLDPSPYAYVIPLEDMTDQKVIEHALQRGVFAYKKRPLWNYIAESAFNFDFLTVLVTYSLFLFIRSVVWAVRTLTMKQGDN